MITQAGYSTTLDNLLGLSGSPQAQPMGDYFSRARTALQASPIANVDRFQQTRSATTTAAPEHHWSKKKLLMMAVGAYLAYKFILKGLLQKFSNAQHEAELYA